MVRKETEKKQGKFSMLSGYCLARYSAYVLASTPQMGPLDVDSATSRYGFGRLRCSFMACPTIATIDGLW
jgi:hypothetical protein